MTPAARLQAAIDILDEIFDALRYNGPAADVLVARYFRSRRYAGSKDRAAVREHIYAALRYAATLDGATGRMAMLGQNLSDIEALFGIDQPHAPPAFDDTEKQHALRWAATADAFLASLAPDAALLAALKTRAPLDLRVNTLHAARDTILAELQDFGAAPTPLSPFGVRLATPMNIEKHDCYMQGRVDVQDDGSQMVALAAHAKAGDVVIDLCAGGGGKSLALAALMHNEGEIIASDVDAERLARIAPRAARLGASIIRTARPDQLKSGADVVLVDAPCTGSGTWRRNPEGRLRLTSAYLNRMLGLQMQVLDRAAELLRGGGRLVYAVCSWVPAEGEGQVAAFLARRSGFTSISAQQLRPDRHGCDGFYIACLEKSC
jgi:16S rRNA (cytosine967-C5)-methyltransferase